MVVVKSSSKICIVIWILMLVFFIVLWYRNINSDRYIAILFLLIGILKLVEYGAFCSSNESQTGNTYAVVVSIIPLMLGLALLYYSWESNCVVPIVMIVMSIALIFVVGLLVSNDNYSMSGDDGIKLESKNVAGYAVLIIAVVLTVIGTSFFIKGNDVTAAVTSILTLLALVFTIFDDKRKMLTNWSTGMIVPAAAAIVLPILGF